MEENILDQVQIFGFSCILGIVLGIVYDIFRIMRLAVRFREWHIFIQDVLYFVLCAVSTFLFVLGFNSGEIRFYIIAGECIGWLVYHITVGELVYRCSEAMICFVKRVLNKILGVTFKPFVLFIKKTKGIVSKIRYKSKDIKGKTDKSQN